MSTRYKNPNQNLPPGVTIIGKDELKALHDEIANLRTQIEQTKADNKDNDLPKEELFMDN